MRKLMTVLFLLSASANASNLVLVAEHHYVARADRTPMAAIFIDERVIASLKLDVYVVPGVPSTKEHAEELAKLTQSSWLNATRWTLLDSGGHELPLTSPALLKNTVRRHGPNAPRAADRDRTVDVTTFEARLDFGRLPAGDYTLRATVDGLTSSFPIAVRTGDEPEVRDTYLELKAQRAATYAEFKEFQLERYRNDPTHIEPIFLALDRALIEGPIDDARSLLSLGIEKIEERHQAATDPKQERFFANRLAELRQVERSLPEYFNHRSGWLMTRDMAAGGYVIKDRKTGALLQRFARPEVR